MITKEMLQQPMKLQVGDRLYEEGIDFWFDKETGDVILKEAPKPYKPKRWWQFWRKKEKPLPINFVFH